MSDSRIRGLHRLPVAGRIARLRELGWLGDEDAAKLVAVGDHGGYLQNPEGFDVDALIAEPTAVAIEKLARASLRRG